MCGLIRPQESELNALEKEYLRTNPLMPVQYLEMVDSIDVHRNLGGNIKTELANHLGNVGENLFLWISLLSVFFGGGFLLLHILFPLSFIVFWAGLAYVGYDSIIFLRAVTTAYLMKSLQMKRGLAPYSVHFKMEKQLEQLLESLRSVTSSIFERDWTKSSPELRKSAESFQAAVKVLTERIRKYALVALQTSSIIWRNNVYAILAMDTTPEEKALAIGNKIREGEALLLRFRWLVTMGQLPERLKEYFAEAGTRAQHDSACLGTSILEQFHLTPFGPVAEDCITNFEDVPLNIPFKGRMHWHRALPPFPLEDDGFMSTFPQAQDLFDSLKQVRQLKSHLEDQMVLNCVAKAISEASTLESGYTAPLEGQEIVRDSAYAQYLDIPKFRPDSQEVQEEVDKLVANARVSLGTEDGME